MEKSRHSRKRIYLIAGYLFFIAVLFFLLLYGFANNRGTPENKQEPKVENAGAPIVVNRPISPMTIEDALFYYAASGNIEALKLIFLSDINVDTKDNDGDTPLNVACICGNIQSVRYLFSLGADINSLNNSGRSPLMNSVINENYEIFQFLIESGAEVDSDALIEASCRGRSDMVLLIIKKEVDVNERTDDGVTSLLCAVSFNRDKVVKLLLDEGADPFIEDKNGWSSYDLGIHKNYEYFIGMVDEMYDVHTIQPRSR